VRFAKIALNLAVAIAALSLAACGGSGQLGYNGVVPTPTPVPTTAPHLYVEFTSTPGSAYAAGVAVYALPLTSNSAPLYVIGGTFGPLAFDPSGNIYTTALNQLREFSAPLSASSLAVTLLTQGTTTIPTAANDIGFDQYGDLWMQTSYDLREFPAPVTATSSAATIVSGGGQTQLVLSPSGTMYAGPQAPAINTAIALMNYGAYPYTAPKKINNATIGVPLGWAPDGTILAYTNGYVLPNTTKLVPPGLEDVQFVSAFPIVTFELPFQLFSGQNAAHTAAMDIDGTFYAISAPAQTLNVFAWPMTATSKPSVQLACVPAAGSCFPPTALYLGP
jgi:hypothetical protein